MKFPTKYSDTREKHFTEAGSPIKDEFAIRIIDGEEKLVKVGESSLYDYIQSHADSVDIHKILERCRLLDDYSSLYRMPAEFMDVTMMPKNLAEAFAMTKDAENYFDMLPIDIKKAYDNNFLKFIQDIGSDNFNKNVSEFLDSIKEKAVVKEENNE